jgi:hypothetical protein
MVSVVVGLQREQRVQRRLPSGGTKRPLPAEKDEADLVHGRNMHEDRESLWIWQQNSHPDSIDVFCIVTTSQGFFDYASHDECMIEHAFEKAY